MRSYQFFQLFFPNFGFQLCPVFLGGTTFILIRLHPFARETEMAKRKRGMVEEKLNKLLVLPPGYPFRPEFIAYLETNDDFEDEEKLKQIFLCSDIRITSFATQNHIWQIIDIDDISNSKQSLLNKLTAMKYNTTLIEDLQQQQQQGEEGDTEELQQQKQQLPRGTLKLTLTNGQAIIYGVELNAKLEGVSISTSLGSKCSLSLSWEDWLLQDQLCKLTPTNFKFLGGRVKALTMTSVEQRLQEKLTKSADS